MFGKQRWPGVWGHCSFSRKHLQYRRGKVVRVSCWSWWNAKYATWNINFGMTGVGYIDVFFGIPGMKLWCLAVCAFKGHAPYLFNSYMAGFCSRCGCNAIPRHLR